jgi:hypothetical protein
MIFSDVPSPAEAGFVNAENWFPLFEIMLSADGFQAIPSQLVAAPPVDGRPVNVV